MAAWDVQPGDLVVPFIFVPHGAPDPVEWKAAHPGWVKFPATFVPREPEPSEPAVLPVGQAAVAGSGGWLADDALAGIADAVGAAAEAVAPPVAALSVLLRPSHTASPDLDEVHPAGRSLAPPGPLPPLPGRAPPVPLDPRPGEGGFTTLSPTPPTPGFSQAPPPPSVLPGRPIEEPGPTILQQDRNDGLSGGSRTRSERARKAAREADPEVTRILPDADWEAHHLINLEGIHRVPDVIDAAKQAGWRTDDSGNVAALPASQEAQRKLQTEGIERPVHDSGHRNWNKVVRERLLGIRRALAGKEPLPGTGAYNQRAREQLENLQDELRQLMMKDRRMTQNAANDRTMPA